MAGQRSSDPDVRHAILRRWFEDLGAGRTPARADYLSAFPGHEPIVDEVFAAADAEPSAANRRATFEGRARIGAFELLEELGRGGQGTVFLARDTRLNREVALKLISRQSAGLTTDQVARVRREAEAVSRLDHPAICTVLEYGEDRETIYIAMRRVHGETLAKTFGRALRGEAQSLLPRSETSTERGDSSHSTASRQSASSPSAFAPCLAFVEQAARALQVAHAAGIVHRDVKPGNIMVTPADEPVILDFGLARDETDPTHTLTRTGDVFGTPAYMSPEQVQPRGRRADARADVYSLAVVLFECLTLRRPFEAPSTAQLFTKILDERAPDPRKFNPRIPRDLALVLDVALDKDPAHRYATADQFAEDLRRVRELEPILARPVSRLVHAQRWVQRNRVLSSILLLLFATLSAGMLATWSLYRDAQEQRTAAERSLTESRKMNEFMTWMLSTPTPYDLGRDATVEEMLAQAEARVDAQFGDDPKLLGDVAHMLGSTYMQLGKHEQARGWFVRATEARRQIEPMDRELIALSMFGIAQSSRGDTTDDERVALFDAALEAARVLDESRDAVQLQTLHSYTLFLTSIGRLDAAARRLDEIQEILNEREEPASLEHSSYLYALGTLHSAKGEFLEAVDVLERAAELAPADTVEQRYRRLSIFDALWINAARAGDMDAAVTAGAERIAYHREFARGDHPMLAIALDNYGNVLRLGGRLGESEAHYREALAMMTRLDPGPNRSKAISLNNLGSLLGDTGRPAEALPMLEQSLEMMLELAGPDSTQVAACLGNIGDLHDRLGHLPKAADHHRRSLELWRAQVGQDHLEAVSRAWRLVRTELRLGELDRATKLATAAIESTKRVGPAARKPQLGRANEVAIEFLDNGRGEIAERICAATADMAHADSPDDAQRLARYDSDLGWCYFQNGRVDHGRQLLEDANRVLVESAPESDAVRQRTEARLEAALNRTPSDR